MNTIRFSIILFVFFLCSPLIAQPPGDLPNEEVKIDKTFEADLPDFEKEEVVPELPRVEDKRNVLNYSVPTKLLSLKYDPPTIKPLSVRLDRQGKVYPFYMKAGIGYPFAPFLNASYNSGLSKDPLKYAFEVFHHSTNNSSVLEHQRFSDTRINGGVQYFLPTGMAVRGDFGVSLDEVYFFGYEHADTTLLENDVKQRFTTIDLGVGIYNSEDNRADVNYAVDLDFYNLGDRFDANETGVSFSANAKKWFGDNTSFGVDAGVDYANYSLDTVSLNNNVLYARPYLTFAGDAFKVKVGVNLDYDATNTQFVPAPNVEAMVHVMEGKLSAFAGWTGGIQQNTFRRISDYNPFIVSDLNLQNTNMQDIYGGVRGKTRSISYEGRVSYRRVNNLALYLADSVQTVPTRFEVLYDTATVYNISGTVTFKPVEIFEILLSTNYNIFDLQNNEAAWHLPIFDFNAGVRYKAMENKLTLKGDLYSGAGVAYINDAGEKDNLNGLFDISLGAQYKFTDNFGLFVDVNNIAGNKRQRWENYPSYGFNIMGGIILKAGGKQPSRKSSKKKR